MPENEKIIRIRCEGAATLHLDEIRPFQGEFKSLSDANYKRLRTAIVEEGFKFPFALWRSPDDRCFTVDGHQRDRVLGRMRDEGFTVLDRLGDPCDWEFPVTWVIADTEQEAKKAILLATSQFGVYDAASTAELMKDAGIQMADYDAMLSLPAIDYKKLDGFFQGIDGRAPSEQTQQGPGLAVTHQCPKCGFQWRK